MPGQFLLKQLNMVYQHPLATGLRFGQIQWVHCDAHQLARIIFSAPLNYDGLLTNFECLLAKLRQSLEGLRHTHTPKVK